MGRVPRVLPGTVVQLCTMVGSVILQISIADIQYQVLYDEYMYKTPVSYPGLVQGGSLSFLVCEGGVTNGLL